MSEFDTTLPNAWDKSKAKETADLKARMAPNVDMQTMAQDIIAILKRHIKEGRVAHVALFITFHDGGNKYFCATEDEPSRLYLG